MSRKFLIQATDIGGDVEGLDIYYNAITQSNLLIAGADISILTSSGYVVTVPDNTSVFYGYASGGLCDGITGSLLVSTEQVSTRFFNIYVTGSGEVRLTSPYDPNTYTGSVNLETPAVRVSIDYSDVVSSMGGLLAFNTSVAYPGTLDGIYKGYPFNSANLLETGSEEDPDPYNPSIYSGFTISGQYDRPEVSDIYVVFSST